MNTAQLQNLIEKYNNQTATQEEKTQLEEWYATVNGESPELRSDERSALKDNIYSSVITSIKNEDVAETEYRKPKIRYLKFVSAAVFVAVLFGGVLIYLQHTNQTTLSNSSINLNKHRLKPGGNNAVLKLADGTELILNQTANGQIANQSGVKITKTKSGELIYTFLSNSKPESFQNNTVSTPRGGQYHLILVDGTGVWLNAASSITFPTAFVGNDRTVKVTGEVYFEVSKDRRKPFIVSTDRSEIKVLGTHFNVNAYEDEDYQKTTLLEGSIEIKKGNLTKLLSPGEQANISTASEAIKIKQIENLDAIIAWKNGYFQFLGSDLQSFMRQISRWYDTEVIYNGSIPAKQYVGKIPRNLEVGDLIKMLAYTGIHCKIENNKITINPK